MPSTNKTPIYLTLLIVAVATAFCLTYLIGYIRTKKYEYLVTRPNERKLLESFHYLDLALKNGRLQSLHDTADFLRTFVYQNSVHLIDDEHGHYSGNTNLMLNRMVEVAQHTRTEKPHLSCGPRAMVLEKILNHYCITNRMVKVYSDAYDDLRSHTFTEVYNTQDQTWHVQDADFNIYYRNLKGKRVGLTEMVFGKSLNQIEPVSKDLIGWKQLQLEFLKVNYFKSMQIGNRLLLNTKRFDLTKRFPLNNSQTGPTFFEAFHLQLIKISPDSGKP